MSKLFTFYNLEIEDSALITVYSYDDHQYELVWSYSTPTTASRLAGWGDFRLVPKIIADQKLKSGAWQIQTDFRKVSNNA